MSNRIKLTRRGRVVVTLMSTIALGFIFLVAIFGLDSAASVTPPTQPTKCVSGTYLQSDNTCLPPNSTRG